MDESEEIVIDPNYEPTLEELNECLIWLGGDPVADAGLRYIAKKCITSPLPQGWMYCKTPEGKKFYFCSKTGESLDNHPCEEEFKAEFQAAKSASTGKETKIKMSASQANSPTILENCDSSEPKASKLVKRHSLDPKMIQSLELDIMRAIMSKDSPVRTERADSDSNPSFTMESFSVTAPDGAEADPVAQNITPADVKMQHRPGNNTYSANRGKMSFCAACCNPIPTRLQVANCRSGPVSAYSVCLSSACF